MLVMINAHFCPPSHPLTPENCRFLQLENWPIFTILTLTPPRIFEYFEQMLISPMKKMKASTVETQKLSDSLEVPVFDMSPLLYSKDEKKISELCASMGKAMAETSILIVRDPRVSKTDSGNFLDMMERYFSQERELLDKDVRAELQYVKYLSDS